MQSFNYMSRLTVKYLNPTLVQVRTIYNLQNNAISSRNRSEFGKPCRKAGFNTNFRDKLISRLKHIPNLKRTLLNDLEERYMYRSRAVAATHQAANNTASKPSQHLQQLDQASIYNVRRWASEPFTSAYRSRQLKLRASKESKDCCLRPFIPSYVSCGGRLEECGIRIQKPKGPKP